MSRFDCANGFVHPPSAKLGTMVNVGLCSARQLDQINWHAIVAACTRRLRKQHVVVGG